MSNFLVKLQDVTLDSVSSVILTRVLNMKPSRNQTFLAKICSMCWFGAELSWPLRTNAEAANEGCSSFYTVSTLLHWGRIHTVLFYKKQYLFKFSADWRNQHWKSNLEQEAAVECIRCCIEDSYTQFKIIRNDQEKVSDASISGIFSSYPLLFEPPRLFPAFLFFHLHKWNFYHPPRCY